ncbi:hypothetical protein SAMN03159463_05591 [Mesorhizobium sp. NFR06]|nr:hypothetical protein SAMN03159463_05591 [Mesorhizobium sp. NFR06]
MPKNRPPLASPSEQNRGGGRAASEENFNRAMKNAIKSAKPTDKAPPLPTKKVVKSLPRADQE